MKWGVRRYQNYDGTLTELGRRRLYHNPDGSLNQRGINKVKRDGMIIATGSGLRRISSDPYDRTNGSRKYFSVLKEDNEKWDAYLGEGFADVGMKTYRKMYKSDGQLRIAGKKEIEKIWKGLKISDKDFRKYNNYYDKMWDLKKSKSVSENITRRIAQNTTIGEVFIDQLRWHGFDGLVDIHGTNVAKLPIILLKTSLSALTDLTPNPEVTHFIAQAAKTSMKALPG